MEKRICTLNRPIEAGGKKFPKGSRGEIVKSVENLDRTLIYVKIETENSTVIVFPHEIELEE